MEFLTKLDRNRFTILLDELANYLAKGKIITQFDIMMLWTPCKSLRPIDPRVASLETWSAVPRMEESVYVTQSYNKNKNKSYKKKSKWLMKKTTRKVYLT